MKILCCMIELKDSKIVISCFHGGLFTPSNSLVQIFDDINKISKYKKAKVIFNFNKKEYVYEYKYDTEFEQICDIFIRENEINIDEIYLEYNGKELVKNKTIEKLAEFKDKKYNIINIFVIKKRM